MAKKIRISTILWHADELFRKLTGRQTKEAERVERLLTLRELLSPAAEAKLPANAAEFIRAMARRYTVSSITVSRRDGSVVMSTDDDAFSRAVKGTSLFEYISSELPGARYLLIKSGDSTYVVYPDDDLLYILQATGEVSSVEVKAMTERVRTEVARVPDFLSEAKRQICYN